MARRRGLAGPTPTLSTVPGKVLPLLLSFLLPLISSLPLLPFFSSFCVVFYLLSLLLFYFLGLGSYTRAEVVDRFYRTACVPYSTTIGELMKSNFIKILITMLFTFLDDELVYNNYYQPLYHI